jgi:acetyl esterase/lipase
MPARTIRCPECNARFEFDPQDARFGHTQCPDCRARVPLSGGPRRAQGGSGTKWAIIIVVLVIVLCVVGCCGGIAALFWYQMKPTDFPEQTQEYADARKTFKTNLVVQQPAPQGHVPVFPPPGVKEVTFESAGLKLKAWVDPPARKQPLMPAVLFLHGGWAFGDDDWDQCKPFRDAGFVTMTPILRGENGQPGFFSMFYDEVDDVLAAAEVLAKTPGVDPNRIFVAGHSVGGTLAMLSAMASKRFKGCASFSGSPDQPVWIRNQEVLVPFDEDNFTEMVMRSPLAFPKSFQCPARLYWGNEEMLFKFGTEKLAEKAKAAGKDVQAIEVTGDHMTAVEPAMKQAIAFFKQQAPK